MTFECTFIKTGNSETSKGLREKKQGERLGEVALAL